MLIVLFLFIHFLLNPLHMYVCMYVILTFSCKYINIVHYICMYVCGLAVRVFANGPVQSQVESYQRLKKWYLMPTCLTLSIIRYGSRVKWSNPGQGVAPSPTPRCSSYRKGSLRVTLDQGRQLNFMYVARYRRR